LIWKKLQFDPTKYAEALEQKKLNTELDTALTLSSTDTKRSPLQTNPTMPTLQTECDAPIKVSLN
jgi:hypothetical protein